ncbi:bifunctional diguanylate cyclase/phosphodiesterase [Motiliproteus coralliicola]|uniref:Bifunctional diguanylate cyclase/phosphodiesterase n=1 Tax=Motiliproteus coralliicola TaxID=2283196 RepID=A0A369WL79_9GAMM|nr:EAL domain-containing protein [Motiliproteus coralliicola]RDE22462.1 bifunctional diguanylate cyclase/phosphodiesterase [Motiliproteus coralliicola]
MFASRSLVLFLALLGSSVLFPFLIDSARASQELSVWRDQNLTAQQIAWLEQHPVLKLGVDRSFSPYEWIDESGHYTGMAADYIRLLEQRLGVEIVPLVDTGQSWSEVLKAAKGGAFHLMSCLVKTPEREDFLLFSDPYLSSAAVIISKQSQGYLGTLDILKGRTVAIHKGHFTSELVKRDYPSIDIVNTPSLQQALELVSNGRADAFVGDANAASLVMKKAGILNLAFSGHTDYQSDFRIGVYKEYTELAGIIATAMASISEAERNAIYQRWQGLELPDGVPLEKIVIGVVLGLALLAVFAYWNYRLRKSEAAQRLSQQRFKNLVETTDAMVWEADVETENFTYISENAVRILGYSVEEWLQPNFWHRNIHPEDRDRAVGYCRTQTSKLLDHEFEYRFVHADGQMLWIRDMVNLVVEDGRPVVMRGLMLDITEKKKAEMLILESEHRFRELIDSLPAIAVQGYDEQLQVTYWNDASERLYGFSQDEVFGKKLSELIIPTTMREDVIRAHRAWVDNGQAIPAAELELQHKDGSLVPVYSSHVLLGSEATGKEMYCIDISLIEQKKAHAELKHLAHFDPLTQLPNRRTFSDRLDQMMKRSGRDGGRIAVMMIDLDHFKEVNDTLGHAYGDLLLQDAAKRLAGCVRETDTVARLGGDEFLLLLDNVADIAAIERIAKNILRQMSEPYSLLDHRSYVTASIGITFYPDDANSEEVLLKNADQAMYAAKGKGRNRFHYFTPEMEVLAQTRRRTLEQLREAIQRQQLEVYYQPIIDLSCGGIRKAEALLRWNHPDGQISPLQFIPLAEETGLIVEIGNWVFTEVARQSEAWARTYQVELQVSVNTSPAQYLDDHCCKPEWFEDILAQGLDPARLCVEITEGLLMEPDQTILQKLLMFRDNGVEVSLDDFGTGYSSLAYLKQFDIDYLKIDKSFVSNLSPTSHDRVLCQAIIAMAHTLGIKVIAEGVETEQQQQLLRQIDCDFAQGYFYSRPLPADQFAATWLEPDSKV